MRFERPDALFPDVNAEGSRHLIHAWEIVDSEFKRYEDWRMKQSSTSSGTNGSTRAESGSVNEWEDEDPEYGPPMGGSFPQLKHNYTSVT